MKPIQKFALLAASIFVLATGCKKEDIAPGDMNNPGEPGTFRVAMTDSPGDYEALDVEILKVEAYLDGQGWVSLNDSAQMVSVLSLTNGVQTQLSAESRAQVQVGTYSMVRLTFGSNNTLDLNTAATLELGGVNVSANGLLSLAYSGEKQITIAIDEEVSAESGAEVLIDFDVANSIVQSGNQYFIQPALSVIHDAKTGVRGHVEGAASAMVSLSNESGEFHSAINAQGDFLVRGMEDGIYELSVMPGRIGESTEAMEPKKIEGVVIASGEITSVGTIQF